MTSEDSVNFPTSLADVTTKYSEQLSAVASEIPLTHELLENKIKYIEEEIEIRVESLKIKFDAIFQQVHENMSKLECMLLANNLHKINAPTDPMAAKLVKKCFQLLIAFNKTHPTITAANIGKLIRPAYYTLVSTSWGAEIWNPNDWSCVRRHTKNFARSLCALPGGKFATGEYDICVWSIKTCKIIKRIDCGSNATRINFLCVLHNGDLASAGTDMRIKIWSLRDYSMLKCIDTGHTNEITGLCVLHNGNLISASRDDSLKIWNAAAGFALATHIKDMAGRATTSICALTNGRLVSGGFCVPMLKIWNLNNYSDIKTIERPHDGWLSCLCVLANGTLVSGSYDNVIKIWNSEDFSLIKVIEPPPPFKPIRSLHALPDGNFVSVTEGGSIKFWNYESGESTELTNHTWVKLVCAVVP